MPRVDESPVLSLLRSVVEVSPEPREDLGASSSCADLRCGLRLGLPCGLWIGLLASACALDTGSSQDPFAITSGSTGTPVPPPDSSDDGALDSSSGSAEPEPLGPRKRRLDLDPQVLTSGASGTTLLVVLDASRIEYADTQEGGADLRFFGPEEGAAYPIEIEHWDPTGRSFVWVRVPGAMLPDHLWMYYGDGKSFASIDPAMVWDDDFLAVWHMQRRGGSIVPDITGQGHDLMPFNFEGTLDGEGQIGRGAELEAPPFETEQGPLDLASADLLGLGEALTIEAWVAPSVAQDSNTHSIVRKGSAYELRTLDPTSSHPALVLHTVEIPGQHTVEASAPLPVSTWTYVVATYQASTGQMTIYRDGALEGSTVIEGEPAQRQVQQNEATAQVAHNLLGGLDEVRISRVARPAAWVQVQYASMADALLTFGEPVPRG